MTVRKQIFIATEKRERLTLRRRIRQTPGRAFCQTCQKEVAWLTLAEVSALTNKGADEIKRQTGRQNQGGDENSFFGFQSGQETNGGNLNTFIGRNAGISNITGSSNTVLGGNANVGSSGLTNATAIGAGTIATNSDTIQLGRDTIDSVRIGRLGSNGTTAVCLNSVNGFATCSSSMRYKSNIADYNSGLSLIKRLRPVSFNWKDGGLFDFGLVAEEVYEIEPLLVTMNDKGEIEGVKYDRIGVVMVNAMQEQQKQIDAQAAIIKRQQAELDALKTLVCRNNRKAEICRSK